MPDRQADREVLEAVVAGVAGLPQLAADLMAVRPVAVRCAYCLRGTALIDAAKPTAHPPVCRDCLGLADGAGGAK